MKNKKLIIAFSICGGAVLVALILCLTLFRVHSVSLNFKGQTDHYNQSAQEELLHELDINGSVFLLNKTKLTEQIEKNNAYLKVINIETVFPNKIIIHVKERQELYVLKSGDNMIFVDEDFKVLSITSNLSSLGQTVDEFLANREIGSPIYLENIIINNPGAQIGDVLDVAEKDLLKKLYPSFYVNNRDVGELKFMIKKITLSYEVNFYTVKNAPKLTIIDSNDFITEIYLPNSNLDKKVQVMLLTIPELSPTKYATYKLLIEENPTTQKLLVSIRKR